MIRFLKNHSLLILSVVVVLATIITINPFNSNIPINDDWDFYLHVRYFLDGYFMKNAFIDSAFILQGFLGMLWSTIFGLSFVKLKILTTIFFISFLLGVYKFGSTFTQNKKVLALLVLAIAFNPIVFISGLSFMTEIYFLAFFIWSLVLFNSYTKNRSLKTLFFVAILTGGSLLVRQFGFVLFAAYVGALILEAFQVKVSRILNLKHVLLFSGVFSLFVYVLAVFPQVRASNTNFATKTVSLLGTGEDLLGNLKDLPFVLTYLGFFLLPLLGVLVSKSKAFLYSLVFSIPIAFVLYNVDIFPIGNVLHIEGLFAKSNFVHTLSLFDNVLFKLSLSYLVALTTVCLIRNRELQESLRLKSLSLFNISLMLLLVGMVLAAFVTNGALERYYLNFFVIAEILIFTLVGSRLKTAKALIPGLILLITITTFLTYDFFASETLKWRIADRISREWGINDGIQLSGVYSRYIYTSQFKDPRNANTNQIEGNFVCHVQKYTEGGSGFLYKVLNKLETDPTIGRMITNPPIHNSRETPGFLNVYSFRHKIKYKESYFTPLAMLLNQDTFIAGFCFEDKNY